MQVEASCAMCGAPASKKCQHEEVGLKKALDDAHQRWMANAEMRKIRHWVLNHAREWIIYTFNQMVDIRKQQYEAHLKNIPYYDLYKIYSGRPPISPAQMHDLRVQMSTAHGAFQRGIDEDWKNSLQRYPEVLDYYFSLVDINPPSEKSAAVMEPQFGVGGAKVEEMKRREVKGRRKSATFMIPSPPIQGGPFGMRGPAPMSGPGIGRIPPPFGMPMPPGGF